MATENLIEDEITCDIVEPEENEEVIDPQALNSIVIYSRDWTIETMISQIEQGNIDLNPKFQRRNAWKDDKRSRLIESFLIGYPVPEIVLAEDPNKKKSFIVIDGKQRLLTVAGFVNPERVGYWNRPYLEGLKTSSHLNGRSFDDLKKTQFVSEMRNFLNADVRCTVVSSFSDYSVLYDIFYRLNTGSVPLRPQELRQVLYKGEFADFLMEITKTYQPVHDLLRIPEADPRLADIELILRFISFNLFSKSYQGNLRKFLDESMGKISENWKEMEKQTTDLYGVLNHGIRNMKEVFGEYAGRKYTDGKWENRFNKALFDVLAYFFSRVPGDVLLPKTKVCLEAFKELITKNELFRKSLEIATNNLESVERRFRIFSECFNSILGLNIEIPALDYVAKI